jgi:subtilisin family serine protease
MRSDGATSARFVATLLVLVTGAFVDAAERRRERDELIVAFHAGVSRARVDEILRSQPASTIEEIGAIRARVVRVPETAIERIASAWDVSRGDPSVQIAILDTGVDAAHPDLAGRVVAGWNFFDGNGDSSDLHGHGT